MTRRSVMNDRYRVERSGKTRKSASAAKPKRAAGEAAAAPKKKTPAKPKSALGRLLRGDGSSRPSMRIEPTPKMRQLTRVWWILMASAILVAGVMTQTSKLKNSTLDWAVIAAYALALGGAVYVQIGPLKRARIEAAELMKAGKSGKKAAASQAPAKAGKKSDDGGSESGTAG